MDLPFDVTEWQPSKPPAPEDLELDSAYVESLCTSLNVQTQDILKHPYDPNTWLRRATTLTRLRYPELAVGDAHKAGLLCKAHVAMLTDGKGWRMGHRMGFWMVDEVGEDDDQALLLKGYLGKLQERTSKVEVECTNWPGTGEGQFRPRRYPWTEARYRRRSGELLAAINHEFAENVSDGDRKCVVRRHAFGKAGDGADTSDVLGVFAARDIRKGDTVLIDKTRVWGCNGPGAGGDYENLHGGRGCYDPIHPNTEEDETWMDLRWIRDRAGSHAYATICQCRLLLCCIQDAVRHPLEHPLVARMTPTYSKDEISTFSLTNEIATLNEALQRFGIDIFADARYDTWVLFTIRARLQNNTCGNPIAESLNPLFSLFNHSCEPNVGWTTSEDHQTVFLKAESDVREVEQLFVAYNGAIHDKSLEERREVMWRWLDGPCQCTRCVREEAMQKEGVRIGERKLEKPEWDIQEKPVFPEDLFRLRN